MDYEALAGLHLDVESFLVQRTMENYGFRGRRRHYPDFQCLTCSQLLWRLCPGRNMPLKRMRIE